VPNPRALAADPAAMSRFVTDFIGLPGLELVRWDYLAALQSVCCSHTTSKRLITMIGPTPGWYRSLGVVVYFSQATLRIPIRRRAGRALTRAYRTPCVAIPSLERGSS
jgi:hypothetical protein